MNIFKNYFFVRLFTRKKVIITIIMTTISFFVSDSSSPDMVELKVCRTFIAQSKYLH